MISCTRRGCGQEFDPSDNEAANCNFHTESPLFHEGLKSWSCCSTTINKPVTSFDEFMALKGCTTGTHSAEREEVKEVEKKIVLPSYFDAQGKECYGTPPPVPSTPSATELSPLPAAPVETIAPSSTKGETQISQPPKSSREIAASRIEEQDDDSVAAKKGLVQGTRCKRRGCEVDWDGETREGEECWFHPGAPEFREGSKGYGCCTRRVLDFDDFLAIKGCKRSRHLFIGAAKPIIDPTSAAELVQPRSDFYQTPREVHISIFGKGADKESSVVTFEENSMTVILHLPSHKLHQRTYALYGPIQPLLSKFTILGTKCEIILAKADARSWPSFTALDADVLANGFVSQLAFSAGGGRGTMGAKEAVLDGINGGV